MSVTLTIYILYYTIILPHSGCGTNGANKHKHHVCIIVNKRAGGVCYNRYKSMRRDAYARDACIAENVFARPRMLECAFAVNESTTSMHAVGLCYETMYVRKCNCNCPSTVSEFRCTKTRFQYGAHAYPKYPKNLPHIVTYKLITHSWMQCLPECNRTHVAKRIPFMWHFPRVLRDWWTRAMYGVIHTHTNRWYCQESTCEIYTILYINCRHRRLPRER